MYRTTDEDVSPNPGSILSSYGYLGLAALRTFRAERFVLVEFCARIFCDLRISTVILTVSSQKQPIPDWSHPQCQFT